MGAQPRPLAWHSRETAFGPQSTSFHWLLQLSLFFQSKPDELRHRTSTQGAECLMAQIARVVRVKGITSTS